jgi:hypothetical protein
MFAGAINRTDSERTDPRDDERNQGQVSESLYHADRPSFTWIHEKEFTPIRLKILVDITWFSDEDNRELVRRIPRVDFHV